MDQEQLRPLMTYNTSSFMTVLAARDSKEEQIRIWICIYSPVVTVPVIVHMITILAKKRRGVKRSRNKLYTEIEQIVNH